MSTTVTLTGVWVNLAADPSQSVRLDTPAVQASESGPGEIRRYAGGRYRSITRVGTQEVVTVQFRYQARTDLLTLRDWINKTVLYRDLFGRRFYATYQDVPETENLELADTTKLTASITFQQVTYDESA